jgi:hypothetical protein
MWTSFHWNFELTYFKLVTIISAVRVQALVIFPSNKGGCYCPGVYSCLLDQYMQTKNIICSMQEPIL